MNTSVHLCVSACARRGQTSDAPKHEPVDFVPFSPAPHGTSPHFLFRFLFISFILCCAIIIQLVARCARSSLIPAAPTHSRECVSQVNDVCTERSHRTCTYYVLFDVGRVQKEKRNSQIFTQLKVTKCYGAGVAAIHGSHRR